MINQQAWNTFRTTNFFSSLDGLRCISILAVLWHHALGKTTITAPLFKRGFLGVDIFFVISGFLIVTLILREKEKFHSFSLKNFYIRRTIRIFPPYYLLLFVLTLYFLTLGAEGSSASAYLKELPFQLTYTTNWVEITTFMSITWSLSTEEQFYIIWPSIERYLEKYRIHLLFLLLLLNMLVMLKIINLGTFLPLNYEHLDFLHVTFTPILLGVLLAYLLNNKKSFSLLFPFFGKNYSSTFFFILTLLAANVPFDIAGVPRLIFHLCCLALIASCVVKEKHWLGFILRFRFFMRIGIVSYGIYLYHMVINHFITPFQPRFPFLEMRFYYFLTSVIATYLVAECSYHLFEKNCLKLKKNFIRKKQ